MASFTNDDDDDGGGGDSRYMRLYIEDEVIIQAQSIYDICKQIKLNNNDDDDNDNNDYDDDNYDNNDDDVFTNHVENVLNKLNERIPNIQDNSLKQSEVILIVILIVIAILIAI